MSALFLPALDNLIAAGAVEGGDRKGSSTASYFSSSSSSSAAAAAAPSALSPSTRPDIEILAAVRRVLAARGNVSGIIKLEPVVKEREQERSIV
jgi:hypothetical protein